MNKEAEFIAAVEEGLRALEEGRVVSHDEVKARFKHPVADEL
jgi:predicted transcriptional regulator